MRGDVIGMDRLLEPSDIEGLERLRPPDRLVHMEPLVGIGHDVPFGSDRLAHRGDAARIFGRVRAPSFSLEAPKPSSLARIASSTNSDWSRCSQPFSVL